MISESSADIIDSLNKKAWDLMTGNPDKGAEYAREAFKLSQESDYSKGSAESLLNEGWFNIYRADYFGALNVLGRGLKICEKQNHFYQQVRTLNALGVANQYTNQYDKALEYYSQCLEISRQNNLNDYILTALGNTGEIFLELGRYQEALDLFLQEEKLLEITGNTEEKSHNSQSLGVVFGKLCDFEKALKYLDRSLGLFTGINHKVGEAHSLIELGTLYRKLKKSDKAENSFIRGLSISRSIDVKKIEVECLTNLGYLYSDKKLFDKALEYHNQALELSIVVGSRLLTADNYYAVSEIYERSKEYKKAFENYKKYYDIKGRITDEETEKKLKIFAQQRELEQKEQEAEIYKLRNVELKEAYNNIRIISRIGQEITKSLDMETIMMTVSENVKKLMPADFFGIALYEKQDKEIDFKYYVEGRKRIPAKKISIDSETSLAAWCIKNENHVLINNITTEINNYVSGKIKLLSRTDNEPESLIYIPLKAKDEINGVLTVQSYYSESYSEKDIEILSTLASYISIALENSKIHAQITRLNTLLGDEKNELEEAYEKISVLAHHDNLTGLPNRKLLSELLERDMKRAERENNKIAVYFIDLDGFKSVNDTFGHDAGDLMLKKVAEKFRAVLRGYDTVARIGGDEFIAAVPGIEKMDEASEIAKKIITELAAIPPSDEGCCRIGASIGISVFPDDDQTFDGLIRKADVAMYRIKGKKKNSFCFFGRIS